VKALIRTAKDYGYPMRILQAVEEVNEKQKHILFEKLQKYYSNDLAGKRIAVWGLAFKPETDDIREAPAMVLIDCLLQAKSKVVVYDPIAMPEVKRKLGDSIEYANDIYGAIDNADALLVVTEWKEFRLPSWTVIKKSMNCPLVLDGRNLYDKKELEELGFTYLGIGR
ncbi:UDP-glucose 6-dehydrogenase, partial [Parabacteroides sp. OttesenSCG-928-K15]|nr:UDP-glucose 6-dehydrogenase [Parabacteroides sp. OttesenSCG-928-K15]